MVIRMWTLALTLGCFLLQYGSATPVNITYSLYYGHVGHAVSYNYPLKHSYDSSDTYTYRLFPSKTSSQELFITVRQFDIGEEGRFTVFVPTDAGTTQGFEYTGQGERVNLPEDTTLPLNIWTTFSVNLQGDASLVMTFAPGGTKAVPGFHIEYSEAKQQAAVSAAPDAVAPCGPGLFSCYNRECVSVSDVCTDNAACTDLSHNTFAHAFCKDSDGAPVQQDGFWATDFDAGLHGVVAGTGWVLSSKVEPPLVGPPSDHTHYGSDADGGKFIHTVFPAMNRTAELILEHTALVAKENCLSFWYYMDGEDPGQLTVKWGLNKVWQRSGSYGAMWLQAQVNLFCESPPCRDKVIFTAEKATNPDTRMSFDDVSLLPGVCPFNDGDLTEQGWPNRRKCYIPETGQIACNDSYTQASSLFMSRGKCLVGTVIFSDYHTIGPTQRLTINQDQMNHEKETTLEYIEQRYEDEEVLLKIPVDFSIPSEIHFRSFNFDTRDAIILRYENFHIVDNECGDLSIGCYERFMCAEGECIKYRYLCTGFTVCKNGRDELNCTECQDDAFLCDNNQQCVMREDVCDGKDNCSDDSDEKDCPGAAGSNKGSIVVVVSAILLAVYGNPFYRHLHN